MKTKTLSIPNRPSPAKARSPKPLRPFRRPLLGAHEGWRSDLGRLYRGDALDVLKRLPAGSIDLAFADPPFNIGKVYGESVDDERDREAYLAWCWEWLDELVRVLANGGSLFVYNLPRWNVHIAAHLERGLTFRHWIAVDIKYYFPIRGRLYPAHYSLLYFCKGPKPKTFTPPRQPMIVCRHCGMELKDYGGYKDKLDPSGFNLSDVWGDLSPVRHHRYKRRQQGLNELPLRMLDRILDMASKPGDSVLDPFAGSGTTLVAAELKGRRWIGMEIEDIGPIVERFRTIDEDRKVLNDLERSKNRLFTDEALLLRQRRGQPLGRYRILDTQRSMLEQSADGHKQEPAQASLPIDDA